jgi:leucyl/phenylalanyl-tRNA--protein transferase
MCGADLYSEPFPHWLRRHVYGVAFLLRPKRVIDSAWLAGALAYRLLAPGPRIPDSRDIFNRPPGFVDLVRDTSPDSILEGMRRGFHPHNHMGPLKWWAPPQRAVIMLHDVHIEREFRRKLRRTRLRVSFDQAFDDVMLGCAGPRQGRLWLTWLHPAAMRRFKAMFEAGYAHSVEVWDEQGQLVGGLFGVTLGPVFCNLSMFHRIDNASKVGVYSLLQHLAHWGMLAFDNQGLPTWVERAGGRLITREAYVELLQQPEAPCSRPGRWSVHFSPAQTADFVPVPRDGNGQGSGRVDAPVPPPFTHAVAIGPS